MGQWTIENRAWQQVLTHSCGHLRAGDSNQVLRQDIGGGYVRCERCGETYLPDTAPGNPRLLMRIQREDPAEAVVSPASVPVTAVVSQAERPVEAVVAQSAQAERLGEAVVSQAIPAASEQMAHR